jgi:hypothetical protein
MNNGHNSSGSWGVSRLTGWRMVAKGLGQYIVELEDKEMIS